MQRTNREPLPSLVSFLVPVLAPLLALAACGGGGGGGGDAPALPTAEVRFPASGAVTDADSVIVSGRSAPGASAVAAVRVDGVAATSTDGFATWRAIVPLGLGENRLEVEVEDADGAVLSEVAEVEVERRARLVERLVAVDVEPVRGIGYAVDLTGHAVYAFDPLGSSLELVSGDDRGTGVLFEGPRHVAALPGKDVVYVLDTSLLAIVEVDVPSGDRRALSLEGDAFAGSGNGLALDPATGLLARCSTQNVFVVDPVGETSKLVAKAGDTSNGPELAAIRAVAFDPATGDVLVATDEGVQRVDPSSGARELVSQEDALGKGASLGRPEGLAVDPATGRVHVLDLITSGVVRIDPSTGDREVLAELGPEARLRDVAFDGVTETLLVVDELRDSVWSLALDGGSAKEIVATGVGDGPGFLGLLDLETADGRFFGADVVDRSVRELDPVEGDRAVVSGELVGTGPPFQGLAGIAPDPANGRLFAADESLQAVIEVEIATGRRTVLAISGQEDGFERPADVTLLPDGRLLVLDDLEQGLFAFDPTTGEHETISRNGDSLGEDFLSVLNAVALDPSGERVYVSDSGFQSSTVKAVDLATGIRTTVLDGSQGPEPFVERAAGLAVDAAGERLYVGDAELDRIVALDLESGGREVLSSATVGQGPETDVLQCLALDAEAGQLLTFSARHSAVLGVSLESGDRVILSK